MPELLFANHSNPGAGKICVPTHPNWHEQLSPPSGTVTPWRRRVLFKGSLSTVCLLIAPLAWPHKQTWKAPLRQHGCHDRVYPHIAHERAQPAREVGRRGPIVRINQEEDPMVSPQSNGLSLVGEAERCGCLAHEQGAQTISAMSARDPRREGAHAHVRYSRLLDGGGCVANRVDLLVGDRTQKGIDEHLVALIDRQASFPSQRLDHKARRPDAQGAFEFAPLIEDHAVAAHVTHLALLDDLDAQAHQSVPDRVSHALVPGESERPMRHQADLDLRIDAGHLRRGFDAGGSSATDHYLAASGLYCGERFAQGCG